MVNFFVYLFTFNVDYTLYSCCKIQVISKKLSLCLLYEENNYQLECKSSAETYITSDSFHFSL